MSIPKIVRAAAVQLSPVLYSSRGSTEKVCAAIAEAAQKGAELVVFPETVLPYYPYFSFIKAPAVMGADHLRLIEESVTVPGPITDLIASAAIYACALMTYEVVFPFFLLFVPLAIWYPARRDLKSAAKKRRANVCRRTKSNSSAP